MKQNWRNRVTKVKKKFFLEKKVIIYAIFWGQFFPSTNLCPCKVGGKFLVSSGSCISFCYCIAIHKQHNLLKLIASAFMLISLLVDLAKQGAARLFPVVIN